MVVQLLWSAVRGGNNDALLLEQGSEHAHDRNGGEAIGNLELVEAHERGGARGLEVEEFPGSQVEGGRDRERGPSGAEPVAARLVAVPPPRGDDGELAGVPDLELVPLVVLLLYSVHVLVELQHCGVEVHSARASAGLQDLPSVLIEEVEKEGLSGPDLAVEVDALRGERSLWRWAHDVLGLSESLGPEPSAGGARPGLPRRRRHVLERVAREGVSLRSLLLQLKLEHALRLALELPHVSLLLLSPNRESRLVVRKVVEELVEPLRDSDLGDVAPQDALPDEAQVLSEEDRHRWVSLAEGRERGALCWVRLSRDYDALF